jgi:hypothetical protein
LVFLLFLFIGLLFRRRFFGLECFQLVSCLFFAVFRLCSFWGGVGGCGVKTGEFSGEYKGLMVVGEFLVFGKALMLKTGGGWRVQLKSSCFLSFWFSGKGFGACGKEFDGCGKLWLWRKSVRVKECCRLKVPFPVVVGKVWERFFPLITKFALKGSVYHLLWLFKVFQFWLY